MRIPLVRSSLENDTPIAWWEWLFTPLVFAYLFALAVWSLPYFWLHPERHATTWDEDGDPGHQRSLKRWRDTYAKLTFWGRVHRRWVNSRRRRRVGRRA